MKKLITIICLSISTASAEGMVNFKQIFEETRMGVFVDQHLKNMPGVYTSLLSIHTNEVDYVNLNIGYLTQVEGTKDVPLVHVGLRLDNLLALARSGAWGQRHTKLSPLPHIEFGPYISSWFERQEGKVKAHIIYGIGLAVKL